LNERKKKRVNFPLRLPESLRDRASLLASQDGVSLNHFICLAVAEKTCRLEIVTLQENSPSTQPMADESLPVESTDPDGLDYAPKS
jgi:hypothetical protein